MSKLLRILNIRQNEFQRTFLLLGLVVLLNLVGTWGSTVAYAALLKQAGLGVLPWILVFSALLSIVGIAIYTAFVDRIDNNKLLIAVYGASGLSVAVGLVLMWLGQPLLAYPVLYLLYLGQVSIRNSQFNTYANAFYDIQAAKRVMPIIMAGSRAGAIVAGLTLPLLTGFLITPAIIAIWLLGYVALMVMLALEPVVVREPKKQAGPATPVPVGEKQHASYLKNVREGLGYTLQSDYLRLLAIGTLLLSVFLPLLEYESNKMLLAAFRSSAELANFLALLTGVGNLLVLPMLLFFVSRLIARFGLGEISMMFPLGNLVASAALVMLPGTATASVAYFDRTAFQLAFYSPINNLLYNAVPLRMRGRARAFAGGLLQPIGALVGGLVLLIPFVVNTVTLSVLVGALAVLFTAGSWLIRREYAKALVKMLEEEDYSFLQSEEASDLSTNDPATLSRLQKKLKESSSREFTVFMAQLITQIGGANAASVLASTARESQDPLTRAAICEVLTAAEFSNDAVRSLYNDFLADQDPEVRERAVDGLGVAGSKDKQFAQRMTPMLRDPDPKVQVRALTVLAQSDEFSSSPAAVQALDALLGAPDPARRATGIQILSKIAGAKTAQRLVDSLDDPEPQVRMEAAVGLEARAQDADDRAKSALLLKAERLLRDPSERMREAVIAILARVGTKACHQAMVGALGDPSPQVREQVIDVLSRVGKSVIPLVHPCLNAPDERVRKMTAVLLSRVNPREFGPVVIGNHVTGNLLTIYKNYGLIHALTPAASFSGINIMQSVLREQNRQLGDELFFLLGAVHPAASVKIIHESLKSEDAYVRANASEALESMTSPDTTRLISPIFDPTTTPAQFLEIGKQAWDMETPSTAQGVRQLATASDDPWMRTVGTFALGQVAENLTAKKRGNGQDQSAPPEKTGAAPTPDLDLGKLPERKARRPRPADLFAALTDDKPAEEKRAAPPAVQVETPPAPPPAPAAPGPESLFVLSEVEALLDSATEDPYAEVSRIAKTAKQTLAGIPARRSLGGTEQEEALLSTIERIIFLKEVPFFQEMTIDQLRILANVCEEKQYAKDERIFNQNEPGGTLYVVVNGKVVIEQEKRKGSFARLATIDAHSYFGEMSLFDNNPHSASAVAIQDTLAISLRREHLIALIRQHPELSLELIKVLNSRLREANARVADLTKTRPRELHKLFDQFEETSGEKSA